ncbi:GNAT family N-acetyltransferase [Streptomyces sp. NPDC004787]|uniref:GNAT family N-acetyltransferase n=1 Tax=Streptomyces sp. NPDC004787 TaxID=3154291 RepID=UPI00339E8F02
MTTTARTRPRDAVVVDERLTLRRFVHPADLPELHRVIDESVDHLRPWLDWVDNHSPEWTAGFLSRRDAQWEAGTGFTYAVVWEGAIVGACGLHVREDTPPGTYEIGYWLHPSATGRGLATRAVRAVVEEGFRMPGVRQLLVVHLPENEASARIPERLGFTEVERVREEGEEFRVWRLTRPEAAAGAAPTASA